MFKDEYDNLKPRADTIGCFMFFLALFITSIAGIFLYIIFKAG